MEGRRIRWEQGEKENKVGTGREGGGNRERRRIRWEQGGKENKVGTGREGE